MSSAAIAPALHRSTISDGLRRAAVKYRGRTALTFAGRTWSFAEIDEAAGRVAHRLAGGETGLALAGRIRERFGERVACVLVTGEVDEALEQRAAAQNFVILRKPVEPIRLRALLAR